MLKIIGTLFYGGIFSAIYMQDKSYQYSTYICSYVNMQLIYVNIRDNYIDVLVN